MKLYSYIFNQTTILSGYRGSIAHNLHIPREADDVYGIDDEDTFRLYSFPIEYYVSLEGYSKVKENEELKEDKLDHVGYEIRKAFHLLAACNPNVLTYLYNRPEHYTEISEGGQMMIDNRQMFLAKKRVKEAFCGYAFSQLQRMQTGAYKGYMGEKRKKIVDLYGYDTKNATTLIRLLRQGREMLEYGELKVFRDEDRDFLLEIKKGKYSVAEIHEMQDEEYKKVQEAYEKSKLPEENNKQAINELLIKVLKTTDLNFKI